MESLLGLDSDQGVMRSSHLETCACRISPGPVSPGEEVCESSSELTSSPREIGDARKTKKNRVQSVSPLHASLPSARLRSCSSSFSSLGTISSTDSEETPPCEMLARSKMLCRRIRLRYAMDNLEAVAIAKDAQVNERVSHEPATPMVRSKAIPKEADRLILNFCYDSTSSPAFPSDCPVLKRRCAETILQELIALCKDIESKIECLQHTNVEHMQKTLREHISKISYLSAGSGLYLPAHAHDNPDPINHALEWSRQLDPATATTGLAPPPLLSPNITSHIRRAHKLAVDLLHYRSVQADRKLHGAIRRVFLRPALRNLRESLNSNLRRERIPEVVYVRKNTCTEYWREDRVMVMRSGRGKHHRGDYGDDDGDDDDCLLNPVSQSWLDFFAIRDRLLRGIEDAVQWADAHVIGSAYFYTADIVAWTAEMGFTARVRALVQDLCMLLSLESAVLRKDGPTSLWRNPFTHAEEILGWAFWPPSWPSCSTGQNEFCDACESLLDRYRLLCRIVDDPVSERFVLGPATVFVSRGEMLAFARWENGRQGYYCPNLRVEWGS